MTFSPDIRHELEAPLSREAVKTRKQGGRTVSYIEGWRVISEANRIFGFNGWRRETIDMRMVPEGEREIGENKAPGWGVTYICKVRVTIGDIVRDGCGAGHGIDRDLGQAHESAIKEAETDAMKRALMTFGNPFGLALYDKSQANVADEGDIVYARFVQDTKDIIDAFPHADHERLLLLWNSDEQKRARRDFNLHPDDLATLKAMVSAKLPPKQEPTNEP